MIILQLLKADFRRLWAGILLLISLIALSFALSVTIKLQEQGLRIGSARAAERFDLVIGAAGSETQLVLSTIFLQPGLMSLIPYDRQLDLAHNPAVKWSAPLAFGDSYQGRPIVGTTTELLTQGGTQSIAQGNLFNGRFQAVVGEKSGLKIGDVITPQHGTGLDVDDHHHDGIRYTVVGILAKQNSHWDKAIFVTLDTVWSVHGMHEQNADTTHHHDDTDADTEALAMQGDLHEDSHQHSDIAAHDFSSLSSSDNLPMISAIIVKPKTIAAAYQLRQQYRRDNSLAVFPGEVLTKLYSTLGNVQDLLTLITWCTQALMAIMLVLLCAIYLNQRKREIATLRVFGAPQKALFLLIWLGLMTIVVVGLLFGLLIGYGAAWGISHIIAQSSGFDLPLFFTWADARHIAILLLICGGLLFIPARLSYRISPLEALKG